MRSAIQWRREKTDRRSRQFVGRIAEISRVQFCSDVPGARRTPCCGAEARPLRDAYVLLISTGTESGLRTLARAAQYWTVVRGQHSGASRSTLSIWLAKSGASDNNARRFAIRRKEGLRVSPSALFRAFFPLSWRACCDGGNGRRSVVHAECLCCRRAVS